MTQLQWLMNEAFLDIWKQPEVTKNRGRILVRLRATPEAQLSQ